MEDLTFWSSGGMKFWIKKIGKGRTLECVAELEALGLGGIQGLFQLK